MRDRLLNRVLTARRRLWRLVHRFAFLRKPMNYYLLGELGRINRDCLRLQCAAKAGVPSYQVKAVFRRGFVWFVRLGNGVEQRMADFLDNPPEDIRWPNNDGIVKVRTVTAG